MFINDVFTCERSKVSHEFNDDQMNTRAKDGLYAAYLHVDGGCTISTTTTTVKNNLRSSACDSKLPKPMRLIPMHKASFPADRISLLYNSTPLQRLKDM